MKGLTLEEMNIVINSVQSLKNVMGIDKIIFEYDADTGLFNFASFWHKTGRVPITFREEYLTDTNMFDMIVKFINQYIKNDNDKILDRTTN